MWEHVSLVSHVLSGQTMVWPTLQTSLEDQAEAILHRQGLKSQNWLSSAFSVLLPHKYTGLSSHYVIKNHLYSVIFI